MSGGNHRGRVHDFGGVPQRVSRQRGARRRDGAAHAGQPPPGAARDNRGAQTAQHCTARRWTCVCFAGRF